MIGRPFKICSPTPAGHYPWRRLHNGASCRFFVRSGSFPQKCPWRLRDCANSSSLVRHDRVPLRLLGQLTRDIIHGAAFKIAYRADSSSAPGRVPDSAHGASAIASTPLHSFANVAFRPPARGSPPGKTQCCRKAPAAQTLRRCPFSNSMGFEPFRSMGFQLFADVVRPQRSKNGADAFEIALPANYVVALGLRSA